MSYGGTRHEALARVKALVLRVLADRLEHGESIPELRKTAYPSAEQWTPSPYVFCEKTRASRA
jgi:hypothetical protein